MRRAKKGSDTSDSAVATEATTRAAADTALDGRIDPLEIGPPTHANTHIEGGADFIATSGTTPICIAAPGALALNEYIFGGSASVGWPMPKGSIGHVAFYTKSAPGVSDLIVTIKNETTGSSVTATLTIGTLNAYVATSAALTVNAGDLVTFKVTGFGAAATQMRMYVYYQ